MRVRTLLLLCALILVGAAGLVVPVVHAARPGGSIGALAGRPSPTPPAIAQTVAQPAPPPPNLAVPSNPATIVAPGANYFGWALLDRHTSQLTGSANRDTSTNTSESMIKAWIAADYLRRQTGTPAASTLTALHNMIIHSDDLIASTYYRKIGGDKSITELISRCGLKHTFTPSLTGEWSYTNISPGDAARMGQCIADGQAAGPTWTSWLLTAMRQVQGGVADQQRRTGGGRWGIIDGLPDYLASQVAMKNGWTPQIYDHNWHVNCLAITPDWVLAIELHYRWTAPDDNWLHATNLSVGARLCKRVTQELVSSPA